MAFNPSNVIAGAGSLYAAPLGTTEPTTCTGAMPTGWVPLGYTEQGSTWQIKPTVAGLPVEESYWPIRNLVTAFEGHAMFALAESTMQNWLLALNAGIGTSQLASSHGVNSDGSVWVEPVTIGTEVRCMLAWDSNVTGGTAGPTNGRFIFRQVLQTGTVQITRRKGANLASISGLDFMIELPNSGLQPFRFILPASMTS